MYKWVIWGGALLCGIAAGVTEAHTLISISTNVLRSDVERIGINIDDTYWEGPTLQKRAEINFEGLIYRQTHKGELYPDGFATYWVSTNRLEQFGWREVYTNGATFRVISGEAIGATGRIVAVETRYVDAYGDNAPTSWRHQPYFVFDPPLTLSDTNGLRDIGLLVEDFTKTQQGYLGQHGWWKTAGTTIITNDTPPGSFGVAAARLDASSNATVRLPTYHQRAAEANGEWVVRFWAKREVGAPDVVLASTPSHAITATNISITSEWQQYVIVTTASGIPDVPFGEQDVHLIFGLQAQGTGTLLLDDIEVWQAGQTNSTPFLDDTLNILGRLNPGIIRYLRMGGNTVANAIVPRLLQYGTVFGKDVAVGIYAGDEGNYRKDAISIHEQAQLSQALNANPWFCLPGTITPGEVAFFVEYLGGSTETSGGALRAELGQVQPWNEIFDRIYIEFGNEAWNTYWPYLLGGFNEGEYWQSLITAGKTHPAYTPNMLFQAAGQNFETGMANDILSRTPAADRYAIAPYMLHGISTNDLLATELLTHQWFMSYPLYRIFENGMPQQYAVSTNRGVEYTIYEYNYHMTDGLAASMEEEITRDARNRFLVSAANGVSIGNTMLAMMRHYGIRAQCFFQLTQNEYQNARLFGNVISMRGGAEQVRPSFLALELINQTILRDVIDTSHAGDDPYFSITGNFGGSEHTERSYPELYSYAFRDGDEFGLVLANYHFTDARDVVLELPVYVSEETAQYQLLVSAAYTNHNEPDWTDAPQVMLETGTLSGFTNGVVVSVPPASLLSYRWMSDGDMPRLQTSVSELTVIEGQTNSFEVWIQYDLRHAVTVTVSRVSGDTDLFVADGETLVFTPEDSDLPQTVLIGALPDDDIVDGSAIFAISASGMPTVHLTATELDRDGRVLTDGLLMAWNLHSITTAAVVWETNAYYVAEGLVTTAAVLRASAHSIPVTYANAVASRAHTNTTVAGAIAAGRYYGWQAMPSSGHRMTITSVTVRTKSAEPIQSVLFSSVSGYSAGSEIAVNSPGFQTAAVTMLGNPDYEDLAEAVEFRIYGYAASSQWQQLVIGDGFRAVSDGLNDVAVYGKLFELYSAPVIFQHPSSAILLSGESISLSVEAMSTSGPLRFQWYVGEQGDVSQPLAGATNAIYSTPALAETTRYWVRLTDDNGITDSLTATLLIDDTPPEAITDLVAAVYGLMAVRLTWTAPLDEGTGATAYDIRYSTSPITEENIAFAAAALFPPVPDAPGSAESFVVGPLDPLTRYYFAIRSSDAMGNVSDLSNVADAETLDASGHHAVTIVDFGAKLGSGWPRGVLPEYFPPHVDRTGDGTLTNHFVSAYPFSLDEPFTPPGLDFDTHVNSAIFYAGMTLYTVADEGPRTITEGHLNQNHEFKDDLNLMTLPGPRVNPVSATVEELLEAYGVWIWTKDHFYNGGADHPVVFDESSYIAVDVTRYWGGLNAGRWLVRDGDQFFLSEATFAGETNQYYVGMSEDPEQHGSGNNPVFRRTHTLRPADTRWAVYTPMPNPEYPYEIDFDPTTAVFESRGFNDVTAVGFFVERYLSTPHAVSPALTMDEPISFKWAAFRAQALVAKPVPTPSANLPMTDIGGVYLADESVSYDLWRQLFRFGQRRQHVRDDLGISAYVFERDGSMGMMRATHSEHNRLEPVTDITWYDAVAACNALSQWEGLEPAYYTDPDHTDVFKMIFDRDKKELWDERPTIYWNTNAPGFRLPTPAEWEELDEALRDNTYWEHVWFPSGTVADPDVEITRTALGWAAAAPTESLLVFGEQPWWGSPRITFRPVRNMNGTPTLGAATVATVWNYTETGTLPPATPWTSDQIRDFIGQYLPEVPLTVGLANTNHVVDLDFNPEVPIEAEAYPVKVGATEIPYRLWNVVQQWALNNGYTFNYSGAMGSMGAIAGDDRYFHPDEPVTQMSWYDLISWCNALSEMMGLEPVYYGDGDFTQVWRDTTQFRLETFQGERYPNWGSIAADPVDTGFYITNYMNVAASGYRIPLPQEWDLANVTDASSGADDYNWLDFNADGKTQPVGTKLPNPVGLYDMEGNVREWTWGDTRATISRVIRRKGSHFARGFQESHHFIDSHEVPSVGSTHVGFRVMRLHQELSASPALFEYAGTSEQSFSPRTLTISNVGYDAVSYTISTSATWMAVSPASHSGLMSGQSVEHSLLLNTPLAGGTYQGEILIIPDDPGIPVLTSRVDVVITERGTGEVVRVRVDFGRPEHVSGGTWNNITDPVSGSISGLIDTDGFENAINVSIIEPFAAVIEGGTELPDAGLDYPASASRDAMTGGNPDLLVTAWGGDYITGSANQQMAWQLNESALSETTIRSPTSADFNRSRLGGTFYANAQPGAGNGINYNHIEDNNGTNIIAFQYRRATGTGDITGHATFVWQKAHFGAGFDATDLRVTRCRLEAAATTATGSHTIRWLIKQGEQYYVSENTYTVSGTSYTLIDAAMSDVTGWGEYNPVTDLVYAPGSFYEVELSNVTAVGYYVYSSRTNVEEGNILRLNVRAFEVYGAEAERAVSASSRVRFSGLREDRCYRVRLFASLEGSDRNLETEYRIHHIAGTSTNRMNPVDNINVVVEIDRLWPDSEGRIDVEIMAGPANNDEQGRYLLGILELVFTNSAAYPEDMSPEPSSGPVIDISPQNTTINSGESATLSVSAISSGGVLTYQWYAGTSGDTTVNIVGATNSSYTTVILDTAGDYEYWVAVADDFGTTNSVTAVVTVNPLSDPPPPDPPPSSGRVEGVSLLFNFGSVEEGHWNNLVRGENVTSETTTLTTLVFNDGETAADIEFELVLANYSATSNQSYDNNYATETESDEEAVQWLSDSAANSAFRTNQDVADFQCRISGLPVGEYWVEVYVAASRDSWAHGNHVVRVGPVGSTSTTTEEYDTSSFNAAFSGINSQIARWTNLILEADQVLEIHVESTSKWPVLNAMRILQMVSVQDDDLDSDGDGLPDWWEEEHFGGPTAANATALAANQVNTILQSYIAGLNPNDPDALFVVQVDTVAGEGELVEWDGVQGRLYRIHWTDDTLGVDTHWHVVTNYSVHQGRCRWTNLVPLIDRRYYRLEVQVE